MQEPSHPPGIATTAARPSRAVQVLKRRAARARLTGTPPALLPADRRAPATEERRLRRRPADVRTEPPPRVPERDAEMERNVRRNPEHCPETIHDGWVEGRRHRADPDRAR